MKKVLALALALVMAFSMSAMAFAADETTTTTTAVADDEPIKTCPVCENEFKDADAYNDHIATCEKTATGVSANISIQEIITALIELVKTNAGQWDAIESVIIRLVDFIENIGTAAVSEVDVKGAVADLEAALAGAEIPGVSDLLNSLKQKIKDLYAGEVATTVVEETTVAEPAADTGSSSVGIALFAAVSVAAAAAYVCTKKSK